MTDNVVEIERKQRPKRSQLPDEVASYVRELIISGAVRPGDFLRTEPIAEAVGVSNTPVREGLLALRSEGFVRLVPRRGFVVAAFTKQDIRDLFWAQAKLAGELTARAAKNATPEQIDRLQTNIDQYQQAIADGNQDLVAELGHLFHKEINLAADSHRLALLLGSVVKHLPRTFYAAIEGRAISTSNDHPFLLAALRTGDSRRARTLMEEHLHDGADRVIETLENRGLWATK